MKKKYLTIGIVAILLIAICIGAYVSAKSPKAEIFSGINGEKISVYTNIDSKNKGDNIENENVKAGDIIEFEGSKEIVIGVSEDGRYITMRLEDYEKQNN